MNLLQYIDKRHVQQFQHIRQRCESGKWGALNKWNNAAGEIAWRKSENSTTKENGLFHYTSVEVNRLMVPDQFLVLN